MEVVNNIQDLISKNELKEAFLEIRKLPLNNKLINDITNLEARFTRWEENIHAGNSEDKVEINKIINSMLFYLGKFEGQMEGNNKPIKNQKYRTIYSRVIVTILLGFLLFAVQKCYHLKNENYSLKEKTYYWTFMDLGLL